jgi:hypothetical protein
MKKIIVVIIVCLGYSVASIGQSPKTKNLIIVTLDGLRWQEIFQGADSAILYNKEYTKDKSIPGQFWHTSPAARREKLLPFFWNVIGTQGQLYGNRDLGNEVNCANPHWFSYPGYSEMLTGLIDRRIRSNDKIENPNYTVLEFIGQQKGFENNVAAFATWDVFPFILREDRTGIPVNAGKELAPANLSEREDLLNEFQALLPNSHGSRYDAFTFYYAFEFLKRERPRVMFIGFDETDQHSHGGRYDDYLNAANRIDEMLSRLWTWLLSQPDYKDQTTILITTDHGRGKGSRNSWKNHGRLAFGSGQVWFAVLGPDTPALGEMKNENRYFLKQVAKTSAALLGLDYYNVEPVGETINSMISTDLNSFVSGSRK